jgi:D-glycero-D-manno-heptose 1,7-bisphosphate phosphatase
MVKKKLTKIAFLDRDGVINSSKPCNGYIGCLKDFKWIPGAKKTIKFLKKNNFKIIVVTNQSGVARGYFKISNIYKIHNHIQKELKKISTSIDQFYFCPYHKDGIIKKYKKSSNLRKPNNGMFKLAAKRWNIDKKKSFMIGDQDTDMIFARISNIKGFLFSKKNLFDFFKKTVPKHYFD